jgi:sortase A
MNLYRKCDRRYLAIERICLLVAVVCGLFYVVTVLQAQSSMAVAQSYVQQPLRSFQHSGEPQGSTASWIATSRDNLVIGRIEIPKLTLSVPIMASYDSASLVRGVGHIDGTAMPGGLGTLGLAGHRDTYFRPLRNIAVNMEVRVTDRDGTYHYIVDSTEVVTPDRVEVLATRGRPEMTLITCYPFDYVGAAPKRFVVHAHLASAAPD